MNASPQPLQLPPSLQRQLADFRRAVWRIKMAEAVALGLLGLGLAFLALFATDRLLDPPPLVRWLAFGFAAAAAAIVPLQLYRWVWRHRRLDQLAHLLARRMPRLGDELLGVIELVRSPAEQARSPALCEAAVTQVARASQQQDLRRATPPARHRLALSLAGVGLATIAVLAVLSPAAARNTAARLAAPWSDTPRYTFARFEPLPPRLIVPHGEPLELVVRLADSTLRRPAIGKLQLGQQPPLVAAVQATEQTAGQYRFALPPLMQPASVRLRVGDAIQRLRIEPTLRPELLAIQARVALPDYLQRPGEQQLDVRGGGVSLVKGSAATLAITANRTLAAGQVDGQPQQPQGTRLASLPLTVDAARTLEFDWQDTLGLAARAPLRVTIAAHEDQAPTLAVHGLPRRRVVLDSEQLTFQVQARDDFGVRVIGLQWQAAEPLEAGGEPQTRAEPQARGGVAEVGTVAAERVLAAGDPQADQLEATGTFSATSLGIAPQPVWVRVYVEDYLPGRPRVLSPPSLLYVLDPQQHAIWLAEQLNRWHRESLEVRDRERQLHETNKRLRDLPAEQLDQPELRRQVADAAAAERANARRLDALTTAGDDLLRQASRNPEFGVGYLESWSEMLEILKQIAGQRMPSVADLLSTAADAPRTPAAAAPQLSDRESSQQPASRTTADTPNAAEPKPAGGGALRLPSTTLLGGGAAGQAIPSVGDSVAQAVQEQRDLLAEFDRVAAELERVLGNLEGSTLVKRLKAAARTQLQLADQASEHVEAVFGAADAAASNAATVAASLQTLASQHEQGSREVSQIMDDMEAFYQRRRLVKFQEILAEMKLEDPVGGLRQLGQSVQSDVGTTTVMSEFWSDTLDRWAEDLVDPASGGQCPGGKSPASLPPSIVLEVLQILEAEVNLREQTRVAEQARRALQPQQYAQQAQTLAKTQADLAERVRRVAQQIEALPEAATHFSRELQLLDLVAGVMDEAQQILAQPETGAAAIAAETEAIELLLQSRRINPRGGGGGGSDPGGGGGGTTVDSAIALLGSGVDEHAVRAAPKVSQATGQSPTALPEEFRSGLDEYFNRLEQLPERL